MFKVRRRDLIGFLSGAAAAWHSRRARSSRTDSPSRPLSAIRLRQKDSCSFDHLVGAHEQRRRHVAAERLGGLARNGSQS
jgi:hypothetical protein